MAKTELEKEELKRLKQEYKNSNKRQNVRLYLSDIDKSSKNKSIIQDGLMPYEQELSPDFPIYASYFYVIKYSDDTYKVISSMVQGKPSTLLRDINAFSKDGKIGIAVYNCNMKARGFYN